MDTELSVLKCFKRHGADMSNGTMAADTIVVNFNIFVGSVLPTCTAGDTFACSCLIEFSLLSNISVKGIYPINTD